MVWRIEIDIEVGPFPLRRDLKLPVSADILEIRTDENLCHVPIPEPICLRSRFRIRLEIQLFIGANEKKV